MSIEQADVVDIVHVDRESGAIVLTLIDNLDWDPSCDGEHLLMLQEKLNTYLRFIESGELLQHYPTYQGRKIVISVACAHPLNDLARGFYSRAKSQIGDAGIELQTIE